MSLDQHTGITPLIYTALGIAVVALVFALYVFQALPSQGLQPVELMTGEWAPYTGEDLPEQGIATATVRRVFSELGYVAEFSFGPWDTTLPLTAEGGGTLRGTFPRVKTAERERLFYFSEPLLHLEHAAFYNPTTVQIGHTVTSLTDIAQTHQILPIAGYEYPDDITALIKTSSMTPAKNIQDALQRLATTPAPLVVIESTDVGEEILKSRLPALANHIDQVGVGEVALHLMLPKHNPNTLEVVNKFNAQIAKLQTENAFDNIDTRIRNQLRHRHSATLVPVEPGAAIIGYSDSTRSKAVVLPRGTRVVVVQWDATFFTFHEAAGSQHTNLVSVKLLNGPMAAQDTQLFVDARSIHLQ